jgi:large subunit ribosomal protein L24e
LQDATFEFEKRRNKPVKYDRELMGATIKAMKRVGEIQKAREDRYYNKRMAAAKGAEVEAHAVEIKEGIDLLQPAAARKTDEVNVLAKSVLKSKKSKMDAE